MRTTLDIADDVLLVAKAQARHSGRTLGETVTELARKGLQAVDAVAANATRPATADKLAQLGIQVLPLRGRGVVTNELVNRIRDDEGI